jgi:putative flavoprotein involved in K+ transport
VDSNGGTIEEFEVVVVGAGQAGLAVGYQLARQGRHFVILDANPRVGDSWRKRWDSLRLFTPARYDGLPGWPFPAPGWSFPTRDEMADYLEAYAARFGLPVRGGVRADRLAREGGRYVVSAGKHRFVADSVVVTSGTYGSPRIPAFAGELDPGIVQLHSSRYRNPSQLREGAVLVVGAGNSGADIGLEAARGHRTWLSGRDVGHIPVRIESWRGRLLGPLLFFVGTHVLSVRTRPGRKLRPRVLSHGGPLIRVKPEDIAAAGIERVPRVAGVRDGAPLLEDGRVLQVANVIWCTGFWQDLSWIDLPVLGDDGRPLQRRGVVEAEPGLYFVGQLFQSALTSSLVGGVGRDAEHVARQLAARLPKLATGSATALAAT